MSSMEPEVKKFFSKIVNSLSVGLLWMLVNSTLGIAFNLAFFEVRPTIANYLFYTWFLVSLFALLAFYKKVWNL